MNCRARLSYLERLFSRSCLESAPVHAAHDRLAPFAPSRSASQVPSQLHQLKRNLLHAALEETPEPGLFKRLCGAANQAAEIAWSTECPLLVFPSLFEELVCGVRSRPVS